MTTVAWDGQQLASDSRITRGGAVMPVQPRKVFRIRGHLIASAGYLDDCDRWTEWFVRGCRGRRPNMRNVRALVIDHRGRAFVHDTAPEPSRAGPGIAIGSGGKFAMCAMRAGVNARRAVEIAAQFDPHTGGRVQCLKLKRSPSFTSRARLPD